MNEILNDAGAKVLYASLLRMTDDRSVIQQAFQHWVTDLSAQPFDVIKTVASLETYLGLSTQERKVLMIGMHAASNRASHELNAVPEYVLGGAQEPQVRVKEVDTVAKVKAKQAYVELAEGYFAQMAIGVRKVNAGDYRELMSALKDEDLNDVSAEIDTALKKAATSTDGTLDLPGSASEADCQDLCHSLYNLVADIVGPIDADAVSNSALSAILDIEAAQRYDPRNLL